MGITEMEKNGLFTVWHEHKQITDFLHWGLLFPFVTVYSDILSSVYMTSFYIDSGIFFRSRSLAWSMTRTRELRTLTSD